MLTGRRLLALSVALATGCSTKTTEEGRAAPSGGATAMATPPTGTPSGAPTPPATDPPRTFTLLAGGDVSFGRTAGQRLLADPTFDFFAAVAPWLAAADVRFVNLESQLSDQGGVTVHPEHRLVFVGPPSGATALAKADIDIVSLANNHMWDFGRAALLETFTHLERAGVRYVGAGRDAARADAPVTLAVGARTLAFVAVTDIWNQGPLEDHPGRTHVSRADPERIRRQVEAARRNADVVVVSYHGGSEYLAGPTMFVREVLHAAVDAGADAVIGHHPHVVQGVGWYRGVPILYSLGNVTMRPHRDHPWSRYGAWARLTFAPHQRVPQLALCPFVVTAQVPVPLLAAEGPSGVTGFFAKLTQLSRHVAGADIDAPGPDGCARVRPPATPVPGGIP
ncbi:MAG: CapA family protein [Myxococcota bacterium]